MFLSKPGTLFPQNSLSSPLDTDTCCVLGKESCSIKPFISNFSTSLKAAGLEEPFAVLKKPPPLLPSFFLHGAKAKEVNEVRNFINMLIMLIYEGKKPLLLQP